MRYVHGAIGAAVAVCTLTGANSALAAEAEAPLAFTETAALQTTCAKLTAGVNVAIRNETAAKRRVHLIPVEFRDSTGAGAGEDTVCGGLKVKVATSLAGGRGTTATLRAKKKRGGEFSGSLLLFAGKGKVTRREVSISTKAPAKALEASPLIGSETAKLGESDRGPIWIPVEGPAGDLPRASAEDGLTVGAVSGTNGTAAVVYGGRKRLSRSTAKVKLELADGLPPGAYKGKVDLNRGDDEKGDVELEIKVTACWAIAAGLLLLGILAALALQRLVGRLLPRTRLRGRIQGLSDRHKESVAALTAPPGGTKDWGKFRVKNLESLMKGLEGQLGKATKSVVIQIDKKVLESLEAAIAVVEAQIDLLKEIPEHADELEAVLEQLRGDRPAGFDPPPGASGDKPALAAAAREALVGVPVNADKLKPRIEEIDARAKQVRILQGLEDRLADLSAARKTLKAVNDPELVKLDTKLTAIRYLLWTAETAEDLDTAAKEIQDTAKAIAEMWHGLHQALQPPATVLRLASGSRPPLAPYMAVDLQPELLSSEAAVVETLEVPAGAPASPSAPPSIPDEPPAPRLDAESAEDEARRALWAQCLAFVIAALVAVATGLIALYVPNETWGSDWDYLAAAIWGLGVQATVSTLATSLDGLGGLASMLRRG